MFFKKSWLLLSALRQAQRSARRSGSWIRKQSSGRAIALARKNSKRNSKRLVRKPPKVVIDILWTSIGAPTQ